MKSGARESASESVSDFPATIHTGAQVSLRDLLTRGPVALFFYPKSAHSQLHDRGVPVPRSAGRVRRLWRPFCVGVSRDPVDMQASFAERHWLNFPLLSDPDSAIARRFGAKRVRTLVASPADRRDRHGRRSLTSWSVSRHRMRPGNPSGCGSQRVRPGRLRRAHEQVLLPLLV
jgi:peroxiredoxin